MSDLKQAIIDLATRMEEHIGQVENGSIQVAEDLYEKLLPETLTMEVVKDVGNYNTDFIAASSYSVGNRAIQAMANDDSLNEVNTSIKMGVNDALKLNVDRKRTYGSVNGGTETTKFGVVTAAYETKSGKNGGQLKVVRKSISESAAELLK
jgi:hypothetical protein